MGSHFLRAITPKAAEAHGAARPRRAVPAPVPDHVAMMRELRGAGLAGTEGSKQPKLTIKAPSAVCRTGRVYCVVIGTATA